MQRAALCLAVASLLLSAPPDARAQTVVDLSPHERVLLEELQHLTSSLAPTLWADWPSQFPPFILRTPGRELLIGHPHPPDDFVVIRSQHMGGRVWGRRTSDTTDVQASYLINGVKTAVMSAPASGDNPYGWVLTAAHEVFHCYQGTARIRDPFVGKFSIYDDLSFPFPYSDPDQSAALRLEAEIVFRLAARGAGDSASLVTQSRLLPLAWRVQRALWSEPAFEEYKLDTEWSEGVARYTERELARLAATPGAYGPTPAFARAFPDSSYESVFREEYGDRAMINPIRFVGEGVRGRRMFYYLGMGKAYALDRIYPEWRTAYRQHTLDELLELGASRAARLTELGTRYAAAWSSQNAASLAALYAEGGSLKVNEADPAVGRAAIIAKAQGFMTAFPDMVVRMDKVIPDQDGAVFHWTWTGTNTGPGGTGRAVRISGYEEWTLDANGLIVESKGHFDDAEYQRQVGG